MNESENKKIYKKKRKNPQNYFDDNHFILSPVYIFEISLDDHDHRESMRLP